MAVFACGHARFLNDATNLRLETHIQHSIGFVQNQEFDGFHAKSATFNQVHQATRSCDEKIAPTFDLTELVTDIGSTVNYNRCNSGAVRETTRLVVDLLGQFTCWSKNESFRIDSASRVFRGARTSMTEHRHDNWE
mmetsp:Transcript_2389/g.6849  ORF Transcript_2389/g.6849 Transcript_2389/m.6849 type:complete len:136 (-) Transcript_2389:679-1086(-)